MPTPRKAERPAAYADRVGEWYAGQQSNRQRKDHGLFLTPIAVADFMARRVTAKAPKVRVLDPAAGAGILSCAVVEAIVGGRRTPDTIDLVAYEVDPGLIGPLQAVLDHLVDWCGARHRGSLTVRIEAVDFIMANPGTLRPRGLFPVEGREAVPFDVVIANPP